MLKEKVSNGYTFKFIRWRQHFIKDTTVMKIRNRLIILFEVDFWGYFTYLLVKGKDSDDFTFVSIKFYENHREDLERPGTTK